MLCVPFWLRRLLCLISLFSPSDKLSPTLTLPPPPPSHWRIYNMTWGHVLL